MARLHPWAIMPGLIGILIAALAGIGEGQLGIGGPGEGTKLGLLRLPAVRKELKLTPKQAADLTNVASATKEARKAIDAESKAQPKAKPEDNPQGFPDPAREAREAALANLEGKTESDLAKLLDARQRKRLGEIALQVEGARAFAEPELIEKIGLDEFQVEQIREILGVVRQREDQAKATQKRAADLGHFDLEKTTKEQQKVQLRTAALRVGKRAMAEIGQVLTKSQRDRYKKLLGEPFNLAGVVDEKGRKLFDPSADLASSLLDMPAVRKELALTADQAAALDQGEPASKVLKPEQRSRLRQLEIQGEGPAAFIRPDVIRSLNLDEEQVAGIQGILDGLGDARRQLKDARKAADEARKAAGDPEPEPDAEKTRKDSEKRELRQSVGRLNQGVMSRISALLTRRQREAFRKLSGEPFDFAKIGAKSGGGPVKEASVP